MGTRILENTSSYTVMPHYPAVQQDDHSSETVNLKSVQRDGEK